MTDDYDPLHDLHMSRSEKIAYGRGRRFFRDDWGKVENEFGITEDDCKEALEGLEEMLRDHASKMRARMVRDQEKYYSEPRTLFELERGWRDAFNEKLKSVLERCCNDREPKQDTKPEITQESKGEKFARLAKPRTASAVKHIGYIGNLASPNYECTDKEAAKLLRKLELAIKDIKRKFKKRRRTRKSKGRARSGSQPRSPELPSELNADFIWGLLGYWPGKIKFKEKVVVEQVVRNGMVVDDLAFIGSHGEQVPGYFIYPQKQAEPLPAILYCHAHGGRYDIGRAELLNGRGALQSPYGPALVEQGAAVLCLEMPCFGERNTDAESPSAKARLWRGETLFGQMLAELSAGVDFLVRHPMVDKNRIGAMGISMGGTHTFWLAALDDRIKASAHMCCFADLDCLIDTGNHKRHGIYMTVPGLLKHCSTGKLAGLAAPRAQLVCAGLQDWSTPARCFAKAKNELLVSYKRLGAAERIEFCVDEESGHEETHAMRRHVLDFFARNLQ